MKSYTLRPDTFTLNFNVTLSGTSVRCASKRFPPTSPRPFRSVLPFPPRAQNDCTVSYNSMEYNSFNYEEEINDVKRPMGEET
jgi:hypothetical protein